MIGIGELWDSLDPHAWQHALDRYWSLVQPKNLDLECELEVLDPDRTSTESICREGIRTNLSHPWNGACRHAKPYGSKDLSP